jgi:proteic killer suppression protein
MMWQVTWSKKVDKQLSTLPQHVLNKFRAWALAIQRDGLHETRKLPGLHDEPLQGQRKGQRSVRLNKAYRAIYRLTHSGDLEIVDVIEVNKHEY